MADNDQSGPFDQSSESQVFADWTDGLTLLLQSHRYSQDLDCDPWQFAVELPFLQKAGMSCADLRWLIFKGYAEHGHEVVSSNGSQRVFRSIGSAAFRMRSCFCLTESGVRFADSLFSGCRIESSPAAVTPARASAPNNPNASPPAETRLASGQTPEGRISNGVVPTWNGELHRLCVRDRLVKEFKVPSANQEAILTAFEEEGWPARIDDPLPPVGHIDPKRRLHDAIKGLNRNQKIPLIRFRGDGTGEGVQWGLIADNDSELNT